MSKIQTTWVPVALLLNANAESEHDENVSEPDWKNEPDHIHDDRLKMVVIFVLQTPSHHLVGLAFRSDPALRLHQPRMNVTNSAQAL